MLFWFDFLVTAPAMSRFADKVSCFLHSYDLCHTWNPSSMMAKTFIYDFHYLSSLFSTVCPVNVSTGEGVICMTPIWNYTPAACLAAYSVWVTSLHKKYLHHFSIKCFMPSTDLSKSLNKETIARYNLQLACNELIIWLLLEAITPLNRASF